MSPRVNPHPPSRSLMPPRPESRAAPVAPAAAASSTIESPRGTKVIYGDAGVPPKPYVPKDVREHSTPQPGERYVGLLGDNWPGKSLVQKINWLQAPLLLLTPVIAFVGCWYWTFNAKTLAFAVLYYFFSGLGITAGYHRHFAHKAYDATPAFRTLLMLMGSAAFEGSALWWSRGHRAHHKYVDTDKDPYAIIKGFWYAHIGWMLVRQDKEKVGYANTKDLEDCKIVMWQHKNYLPTAFFMCFIVPTLACGLLFGDYWGGYFVAGVARLVFVHHSTFFVNSLAHWAGDATYTDGHTARNSWITALVTLGEGYHNFHHEFPSDYRNGVEWWQYDPTKVFIYAASCLGLAYNLQLFPAEEIIKGQLQMNQKALAARMERLYWGPDPGALKVLTQAEFEAGVERGEAWMVIDGFVCDCVKWGAAHPGGEGYIKSWVGKDATAAFKGETYKHSNAAQNVAATLRVARIADYWAK